MTFKSIKIVYVAKNVLFFMTFLHCYGMCVFVFVKAAGEMLAVTCGRQSCTRVAALATGELSYNITRANIKWGLLSPSIGHK